MNYMIGSLDSNDCRDVYGEDYGRLLGYVILRLKGSEPRWFAYTLDAANDLVFQGRYRTADEAAAAVGRSYSEPGKVSG